ncbi:MAG: transporter [Thermoanaerobaculia bacterium]|nr:transporter [Thermoanaerobaculia bacterium]
MTLSKTPANALRRLPIITLVCSLFLLAGLQASQSDAQIGPLAELIPNLFDRTVVLAETGHQAHFVDSSELLVAAGIQLNSSVVGQLGTFPVSSASGGFTFEFDPELNLFARSTDSFGPIFSERADTLGKGKMSFGINVSRFEYDVVDGLDLRNGDLEFTLTHLDTNHDGSTVETFFEGDLVFINALLDVSSQATVFFVSYGVTERLDLAVAIPIVQVDMTAQLQTTILRQATEGFSDPPFHIFSNGTDSELYEDSGSSSGIGDVLLRSKYRFFDRERGGLAFQLDLRLPTGEEAELLGTGATQIKGLLIGSTHFGAFSPHINLGYTVSSGGNDLVGDLPNEINMSLGFDAAIHSRVTFAGDVLWRALLDARQIRVEQIDFPYKPFDAPAPLLTQRPTLETVTQDVDLIDVSIGLKINVAKQLLLTTNLLYSVSDDGLRDRGIVPLIGLDYSF